MPECIDYGLYKEWDTNNLSQSQISIMNIKAQYEEKVYDAILIQASYDDSCFCLDTTLHWVRRLKFEKKVKIESILATVSREKKRRRDVLPCLNVSV